MKKRLFIFSGFLFLMIGSANAQGWDGLYNDGWYSKYDNWNINSSFYFSSYYNRNMYVFTNI